MMSRREDILKRITERRPSLKVVREEPKNTDREALCRSCEHLGRVSTKCALCGCNRLDPWNRSTCEGGKW